MTGNDVQREANPVREAIKAALANAPTIVDWHEGDTDLLLDHLTAAVEQVPVKVTIRDLDMDPENVITIIDSNDLLDLATTFSAGYRRGDVSLAVDQGYLKVKVSNESWSRPIPTSEYEG